MEPRVATRPPNVLYLHSHDTGRHVEPYGKPVATPNIQHLAHQGALFREAFCAVPTCSGSRACLLTGQYGHSNGLIGLAHRGFELRDYREHIVNTLRKAGYWSALIGEQHISKRPDIIGYDRVVKVPTTHVSSVAPIASRLIGEPPPQPFFLSVGFFETHREFFAPSSVSDALYSEPPPNLQGLSLLPIVRGEADEIRDHLFAEATFHAAYEPQRAVRTRRWKYIRRFGDRTMPVLANTDDGPSKDLLLRHGWAERSVPFEQLYDLVFDPDEASNLAGDPGHADTRRELGDRLEQWMRRTDDPLLYGPVHPPAGVQLNLPDQLSPSDPTITT